MGIAYGLLFLLVIAATVLTFIFIVPERRSYRLGRFGLFIRDFLTMKHFYLEHILRAAYIFCTIAALILCIGGGFLIPLVTLGRYDIGRALLGSLAGLLGGALLAALMLFLIRIIYERAMMQVALTNAARSLDRKINGSSSGGNSYDDRGRVDYRQSAPQPSPYTPPQPQRPQPIPQTQRPQTQPQRPQQRPQQNPYPADERTIQPNRQPQPQQPLKYALCRRCGARFDPRWGRCPICKEPM